MSTLTGRGPATQSIGVNNSISPVVPVLAAIPSGSISVLTMFCPGGAALPTANRASFCVLLLTRHKGEPPPREMQGHLQGQEFPLLWACDSSSEQWPVERLHVVFLLEIVPVNYVPISNVSLWDDTNLTGSAYAVKTAAPSH